jgi:hypothetical protein
MIQSEHARGGERGGEGKAGEQYYGAPMQVVSPSA